jgi:pyruvate/2-oxoglutarate/acetoin dehydrogenase E1 component
VADSPGYLEAINHALRDEMRRDSAVVLLGVDIGAAGGVYGVTKGLQEEFGPERVRDTPIAEAGVLGAAVGAAIAGLRPVAEVMYMDFIAVCLDPIVNQAAKLSYMTGGGTDVPVVFRMQTGGGRSAGAQHSQSLEGLVASVPGLKVFCPADSRDAYDLLVAAVRDPGPVCFVENRRLYPTRHEDWDRPALPPGAARIVSSGDQLTLVTWGRMVREARKALDQLGDAVQVELIDLRTLVPLDSETVQDSVKRTGRCLVLHEAVERFGPGAELISEIVGGEALWYLDGPVGRLGALPAPVPYSPELERRALPTPERIAERITELIGA